MGWGLGVGILMVVGLFALFAIIIIRETSTHRFWQRRVDEGDLEMIAQLVNVEVEAWRTERPPKGMPAAVWQGIQGVELIDVGRDYVHVSTTAEPQFALVGGSRRQVSSAVDEARRVTAKLAERFFYDIPHVRPDRVQIDCYSTFHDETGRAAQSCVMSTTADRSAAADVDWDNDAPEVIAERLGARYQLDARGQPLPVEPNVAPPSTNGARHEGAPELGG